jgi:regulatory associated protein of mTOR
MCAFIIAMFCKDFHQGQNVCLSQELIESCLSYFDDMQNPLLRQWSCLCLSMLWVNFPDAKWAAIKCSAHQRLCDLVVDCVAEVRAAMLHALTSFLGIPDLTPQVAHIEESVASMVLIMASDGSAMVRKELLVFFSTFIVRYQNRFIVAAYEQLVEERKAMTNPVNGEHSDALSHRRPGSSDKGEDDDNVSGNTIFSAVWKEVLIMSVDPHPEIAENASALVDYVFDLVLTSQLATFALPIFEVISIHRKPAAASKSTFVEVFHPPHDGSRPPTPPTPSKEGYFAARLKRTASYAASLTNFAFGAVSPSEERITRNKSRQGLDKHPAVQSKLNGELNRPPDEKDLYHSPSHPPLKTPTPRSYRPRSKEEKPTIPLESKFFEWSVEYFREPQMQPPEAEEPGSTDYNGRLWRRNRNDRIIAKTQPQKEMAGTSPWDKPKGFWNNGTQPVKLCWHQFEDQLVITDDKDGVS